jgi:AcrR family transcriptional regulator
MLQDALVEVMIEKGYESTTVQDIIDRANVGRSTFYAHFADKNSLLASRLEDLRSVLLAEQDRPAGAGPLGFSLPMLQHALAHRPLYVAITGKESGAFVMQRLHRMIAEMVRLHLDAADTRRSEEQRDLAAHFVAGAFMAVLTCWLDRGARTPPDEVDEVFKDLAMQGLHPGDPSRTE